MNNPEVPATVNDTIDNITVYDRISDPMTAIKTLGNSIFKSGIFGIDKPEHGALLVDGIDITRLDETALADWRARLVRRLAGRPEGFSDGQRLIPGRPYSALQTR